MTEQELQTKYDNFVFLVTKMRHYQDLSEMYRAKQDRDNYNRYRRKVDETIKSENRRVSSKQSELKFTT